MHVLRGMRAATPRLVVDQRLLENRRRPLRYRPQQPAANLGCAAEVRFKPRDLMRALINPYNALQLLDEALIQILRVIAGIRLNIRCDDIPAA